MSETDQIVELKIEQHNARARLDQVAQDHATLKETHEARFEAIERLLDEQNRFLGAINVTLDKLSKSFNATMAKVDTWLQRGIGALIAFSVTWVIFSDEPLSKIKWIIDLVK